MSNLANCLSQLNPYFDVFNDILTLTHRYEGQISDQCHVPHKKFIQEQNYGTLQKIYVQSLRRLHDKKLRPDKIVYILNLFDVFIMDLS